MKFVKIFVSAKEDEFDEDRNQLGDFLANLNEIYEDKIFFKEYEYDKLSEITSEYKDQIEGSDLVFILLAKELEKNVKDEFKIALDKFKVNNTPKIVVYFKKSCEDKQEGNLVDFKNYLSNDLQHFYSIYENADTLKLGMIMHIKMLKLDEMDVKMKEDGVFANEKKVLSTDKLPMFFKNEEIKALTKQLRKVRNEYEDLQDEYDENPDDADLNAQMDKLIKEKGEIQKQIDTLKKNMIALIEDMFDKTSKDGLSPRQIKGYQLLEQGKYKEALEVLDYNEIMLEAECNQKLVQEGLKALKNNVLELLLRIKALRATQDSEAKIEEIDEIYESVIELVENNKLDVDFEYDLANYLKDQNRLDEALEYYEKAKEKIKRVYDLDENEKTAYDYACILDSISSIYLMNGDLIKTSQLLNKAIFVCNRMNLKNEELEFIKASCYLKLGPAYIMSGDYDKGIRNLTTAISSLKRLFKNNPARYALYLEKGCLALGGFYTQENNFDKAKDIISDCINILEPFKSNNVENQAEVAYLQSFLAYILITKEDYEAAADLLDKSIDVLQDLYNNNPEKYAYKMAQALTIGAMLWSFQVGAYQDNPESEEYKNAREACIEYCLFAEKCSIQVEDIREKGLEYFQNKFMLSTSLNGIGENKLAKKILEKMMVEFKEFNNKYGNTYSVHLSTYYQTLSRINNDLENYEEAIQNSKEALEVVKQQETESFGVAMTYVNSYYNLFTSYECIGNDKEAKENLEKAIEYADKYKDYETISNILDMLKQLR